jgi:hypothetical protein
MGVVILLLVYLPRKVNNGQKEKTLSKNFKELLKAKDMTELKTGVQQITTKEKERKHERRETFY